MHALAEAEAVLQAMRQAPGGRFAGKRTTDYLAVRRELEERVRRFFVAKGGRPRRDRLHYLVLGACPWLTGWYPHGCELHIPWPPSARRSSASPTPTPSPP